MPPKGKVPASALDPIVNLCKRRGFVFPNSGPYGSIGTSFDFGPLGAQLKKSLSDKWWSSFVERRQDCVGLESALVLNPAVWEASGHVSNFTDPLSDCRSCQHRFRVDKLVEDHAAEAGFAISAEDLSLAGLSRYLSDHGVCCPACGAHGESGLTDPRPVNLLFKTTVGPMAAAAGNQETGANSPDRQPSGAGTDGGSHIAYLRPETAQGAYVQFLNVARTMRTRLPFGIAQMGKSFRNEIRTSNFIFRAREFDQLELQYFTHPKQSPELHDEWVERCHSWLVESCGLRAENVRRRVYEKEELAHYALATTDLEYKYPFGWDELWGIANRGDYDLLAHSRGSGVSFKYTDPTTSEEFVPHVIEPALGGGRLLLAVLVDAYTEEEVPAANGASSNRVVLKFKEDIAPYRAAVLPLSKKDELVGPAKEIADVLSARYRIDFDMTGSIGKRYRRQDEIGTPFCITIDFDTSADGAVTVRCRDSMKQVRIPVSDLKAMELTAAALGLGP